MNSNLNWGIGLFFISLIFFFFTLCPTVYWEDSAALVTAGATLGIPHSPGFPIYILLSKIFSFIPFENIAWRVNFMSALWGSLSLMLLFFILLRIETDFRKIKKPTLGFRIINVAIILFFGFTTAFWSQVTRAEVYSLNLFFTLLMAYLLLIWRKDVRTHSPSSIKWLGLIFFVLGISLTNHSLLIFTLIPAYLFFILANETNFLLNRDKFLTIFILGLTGLTVYLYLPIRSGLNPALNWGKPDSLSEMFAFITRAREIGTTINLPNFSFFNNLKMILSFILTQYYVPLVLLAVIGWVKIWENSRRLFTFLTFIFALNLSVTAWAADFSTRNLDLLGYLLPALAMFTIFVSVGVNFIWEIIFAWFKEFRIKVPNLAVLSLILIIPLFQFLHNYPTQNKNRTTFAYDYAREIADSVQPNSVIFTADDNTLTTLWYLTLAEKNPKNLKIISANSLTAKAYLWQVRTLYPDLMFPKTTDMEKLRTGQWIDEFVKLNVDSTPIYFQFTNLPKEILPNLSPFGLILAYSKTPFKPTPELFENHQNYLNRKIDRIKAQNPDLLTKEHFGNLIFNWGVYYDRIKMPDLAFKYFMAALEIDSNNPRIYAAIGKGFLKIGKVDEAEKFFQTAVDLEPNSDANYYYLSVCYAMRQDKTNQIIFLEKALSLNPSNILAKEDLHRLKPERI